MADELFLAIKKKTDDSGELIETHFNEEGTNRSAIWDIVGGTREQDAETMRLLALTNPTKYTQLKNSAIDDIKRQTEFVYISAYKQHSAAGMDEDACKETAKKAAMQSKEIGFKSLNIRLPAADDVVSKGGLVRNNNKFF